MPISDKQNSEPQLDRLAARSKVNAYARHVLTAQIVLSVPCVIALSIASVFNEHCKILEAAWGLFVTLLDFFVLEQLQAKYRREGAQIQELFDCNVLGLPWNEIKVGNSPPPELVIGLAKKATSRNPNYEGLRNWYPISVDSLPLEQGRLLCQRANCWWDASLRRNYTAGIAVILGILVCVLGFLGLWENPSFQNLVLTFVAPIMPALILGMRQYRDHSDTAETRERLREAAESLFDESISGKRQGDELAVKSRALQDEIYDSRRKAPPVFAWIYDRSRADFERQMVLGTAELVKKAQDR